MYDGARWSCSINYRNQNGDSKTRTIAYLNLQNVSTSADGSITETGKGYSSDQLKSFGQLYVVAARGFYNKTTAIGTYEML